MNIHTIHTRSYFNTEAIVLFLVVLDVFVVLVVVIIVGHRNQTLVKIGSKNAAKQSRQHARKKYREYAQRHVCFVNEQVP